MEMMMMTETDETKPWRAEMPDRWSRNCKPDDEFCDATHVEELVTKCNEELDKVRAERDAALKLAASQRTAYLQTSTWADGLCYEIEQLRADLTAERQARNELEAHALKNLDAFGDRVADLKEARARIAELEAFACECRDNWDCDSDAHRYRTACRACMAKNLLPGETQG